MKIFLMDNGVATDIVVDTTISHNTDSKLLDNVILNNSHTTWTRSANKVPFSNKCLCVTSYINDTQLKILMSDDTINVEHTLVKDSSQIPRSKSLNIIYRNINPLKPELNPICYLLALLGAHYFLHVSRIRVKSLTFGLLMSYIYIWSTHS